MATTPIVTEVTKEQLDALVATNGLNEGLQYKVTDKNWLLLATGINTLKSNSDILTINNNTVLPNYIATKTLFIDTGIVEFLEGSTLEIETPNGYIPKSISIKNHNSAVVTGVSISNAMDSVFDISTSEINPLDCVFSTIIAPVFYANNFKLFLYATGNTLGGSRWVIEFQKSIL